MMAPNDRTSLAIIALMLVGMAATILLGALYIRAAFHWITTDDAAGEGDAFGDVVEPDPLWHPEPAHTVWDDGEDDR